MTRPYWPRHRRRRDILAHILAVAAITTATVWAVLVAVIIYHLIYIIFSAASAVLWATAIILIVPIAILGRWAP